MIASDQPKQLEPDVLVALSSRNDGTMLDRTQSVHAPVAFDNRRAFCSSVGVNYEKVVYQNITYGPNQTWDKIAQVDSLDTALHTPGVAADALFTKTTDIGLFLPVADCTVAVIYDPVNRYLGMAHLGRHSTVAWLMKKMIGRFIQEGSNPDDLMVWMSPGAKVETYIMQWFDQEDEPEWQDFILRTEAGIGLDLPGFNRAECLGMGVVGSNIFVSPVNTMLSKDYFSHAAGDVSGRFAVLAMMR